MPLTITINHSYLTLVTLSLKEIVDRTGYKHEKSSGQHKYGGPPPNFTGPAPGPGQEVMQLIIKTFQL